MTLMIDLQPDIERGLMAQAQAKDVSLSGYARENTVAGGDASRDTAALAGYDCGSHEPL